MLVLQRTARTIGALHRSSSLVHTHRRRIMVQAQQTIQHWDSDKGCPYAQRSWIALIEKDLPYNNNLVDLNNKPEDFKALYASLNPAPGAPAKVPILIDGDVKLYESLVCAEYIAAKYAGQGTPLLPSDPAAAARARLFVETFAGSFNPALFAALSATSKGGVAEAKEKLATALATLDSFIRQHGSQEPGGDYFLGSAYSLAEACTVGFVQRALAALPHFRGIDPRAMMKEQGLQRLEAWVDATLARPSSQQTCPSDEKVFASWGKFVKPLED